MSERLDPEVELVLMVFTLGLGLGLHMRSRKNRQIRRQAERNAEMYSLIRDLHVWTMETTMNCSMRDEGWFDEYLTRARFINIVNRA